MGEMGVHGWVVNSFVIATCKDKTNSQESTDFCRLYFGWGPRVRCYMGIRMRQCQHHRATLHQCSRYTGCMPQIGSASSEIGPEELEKKQRKWNMISSFHWGSFWGNGQIGLSLIFFKGITDLHLLVHMLLTLKPNRYKIFKSIVWMCAAKILSVCMILSWQWHQSAFYETLYQASPWI